MPHEVLPAWQSFQPYHWVQRKCVEAECGCQSLADGQQSRVQDFMKEKYFGSSTLCLLTRPITRPIRDQNRCAEGTRDRQAGCYEHDTRFPQIFLDGRELPKDPNPTWWGNSVGKWDGDTLVVDTCGFKRVPGKAVSAVNMGARLKLA
jgi:hypothetical protein